MIHSHLSTKPGIYKITCVTSGRTYIGSSKNIRSRIGSHITRLKGGYHHNPLVQNTWDKHGAANFTAEVVLLCDTASLCMYEQLVVDALRPDMNMRKVVESCLGMTRSAETRQRISEALRGKMPAMTTENRRKASERAKQNRPPKAAPDVISKAKRAAGKGKKYCVAGAMATPIEIAEIYGIHRKTFMSRIEQGWSADDAATKPVRVGNYNGGHKQS